MIVNMQALEHNMKILAIIPARGGSKGLPRKNIRLLNGLPLIEYSIKSAFKSKYIDKVVVSTEDTEIKDISEKLGGTVIVRPKRLAEDDSKTIDVIVHVLENLEKGYFPQVVVILQPTSPLRTSDDIDSSIKIFLKNDCDSVVSVCEFSHSPYWALTIKNNHLTPIFGQEYLRKRRQELPISYIPNGAIFVSNPEKIREYESFYASKTLPYVMPINRSVDIDSMLDFKLAEIILEENNEFY
jgi:CMP-N-acetylneuraminic acid synthetase